MIIHKSEFRLMETIGLTVLITAVLLFAAYAPAAASAQNLFPLNNSNNSSTANLNSSSKELVNPQGNKATITTANPTAAGQTNNSQGNNRTGFANISNLVIKDKTFPIKYNITNGKLLGIIGDKDKTTMIFLLGGTSDNGKLTVELPRNVLDAKSQGNTDTKYHVKIDNKDVDYKEVGTNLNARILQIDISKDDRMMEIAGTQMAS